MAVDLSGGPYLVGVIGDPVAHSLSPALHQPALHELGIPATYERWHTPATEVEARIAGLRRPDILGANVTVPHKIAALRLVDSVSVAATRAGAVNTIVNRRGRLFGDNTDIYGFSASMTEAFPGSFPGTALVLGAGGAARAVVLALEALGVTTIIVANRDMERRRQLAADLVPAPVTQVPLDADALKEVLPTAGLLVNATSLGWRAGESPIDCHWLQKLPGHAVVVDLTYRETDLLKAASELGLKNVDGLSMLVHQGARAFELFTGLPAPLETMLGAAKRARG